MRKSRSGFLLSGNANNKVKKLGASDEEIDDNNSDSDSSGFSP